jgi:hypothetical protein
VSTLATAGALGIALVAVTYLLTARRLGDLFAFDRGIAPRVTAHPIISLFLASFAALFIEIMLIRYLSAQLRVFAFYKNIPLISAYLGLGLGCWLGKGHARHVHAFLMGMLPIACALSLGTPFVGRLLGDWSAAGSSEHILGDRVTVQPSTAEVIIAQAGMGMFCVATLVALTLLFALLGRLLGQAFEGTPRLRAYTINIVGSLAGIATFLTLCYLETPPWCWFLVGLTPLLWWLSRVPQALLAVALITLCALKVSPSFGNTV